MVYIRSYINQLSHYFLISQTTGDAEDREIIIIASKWMATSRELLHRLQ
jgi:hypothetical protein